MSSKRRIRFPEGRLLLLLFAANLALGLFFWLPSGSSRSIFLVIPETVLLAGALFLLSRLGSSWRRVVLPALLVPVAVLLLFGLGESFFQHVYREHFVPWRDLAFLPGLLNMVFSTERFNEPLILGVSLLIPVLITAGAFFLLLRLVVLGFAELSPKRASLTVGVLLLLALPAFGRSAWTDPLSSRLARQIPQPDPPGYVEAEPAVPSDEALPLLGGGDLRLFVIESYGHTLFSRADHNELIMPVYRELEEELRQGGYSIASHFMESPAFGGRSWLADGTILSGAWLADQAAYDGVKKSERTTLIDVMNRAGYETVLAAPGMTYYDDGYREFYRFDRSYIQEDFLYDGPYFSFGIVPDQYLLHFMRRETAGIEEPLFTAYIMVSSHVPFRTVPPYVKEWERLGEGEIYHSLERRYFDNNWLSGGEYPQGYTASIAYSLRSATDYILRYLEDGDVAVVIGDHQPRIPISERNATYSVPVHVLSRMDRLVEPLREYGFRDGLVPSQETPHPRMDRLYPMLYDVFRGVPAVRSILAP
ncbi:MAG: hypothetical protein ACLFNP_00850 [Spirochaetaceae bacterium]